MSPTERTDIFPSTHATWLHTRIESVCDTNTATSALAARELREHLMLRYHNPLCAYVRGSSLRTLGEPEELVHEFFARARSRARSCEKPRAFRQESKCHRFDCAVVRAIG